MKDGIGQAQNKHPLERDKMETMLRVSRRGPAGARTRAHAVAQSQSHAHLLSQLHTITPTQSVTQSHHAVAATHNYTPPSFLSDVSPPTITPAHPQHLTLQQPEQASTVLAPELCPSL